MKKSYINFISIIFIIVYDSCFCSFSSYMEPEYPVEAETQLSLGGQYTEKVREAIKNYDEFFVAFMYRFDHPAFIRDLDDKMDEFQTQDPDLDPEHPKRIKYPPLVFLDYNAFFTKGNKDNDYKYHVKQLHSNVSLFFVKIGGDEHAYSNKTFHHKVIISKKKDEEASVFIGSANATYHADYHHSEDTLIIKSNILAADILKVFDNFLNSQDVKISDAHSINNHGRKINKYYLVDFYNLVVEGIKTPRAIMPTIKLPTITSFVISTGTEEKSNCFKFFEEEILNKTDNKLLIYFQNYFNIYKNYDNKKEGYFNSIRDSLDKGPLKLIVRWDQVSKKGKESQESFDEKKRYFSTLEKPEEIQNNQTPKVTYFINFKPYTQGIFHHKAIIQYLNNEEPILYTGSFHFSVNAIKNNSENIIGVRSKKLVEDYLYSLLLNSNLAEHPGIWRFFSNEDNIERFQLDTRGTKIHSLALKVRKKCKNNMYESVYLTHNYIKNLINALKVDDKKNSISAITELKRAKVNINREDISFNDQIEMLKELDEDLLGINFKKTETLRDHIKGYILSLSSDYLKKEYKYLIQNPDEIQSLRKNLSLFPDQLRQEGYETWIDILKEIIDIKFMDEYNPKGFKKYIKKQNANATDSLEILKQKRSNIEDIYYSMAYLHSHCLSFERINQTYLLLKQILQNQKRIKKRQRSPLADKYKSPTRSPKPKKTRTSISKPPSIYDKLKTENFSSQAKSLLKFLKENDYKDSINLTEKNEVGLIKQLTKLAKINDEHDLKEVQKSLNNINKEGTIGYYITQHIIETGKGLISSRYQRDINSYTTLTTEILKSETLTSSKEKIKVLNITIKNIGLTGLKYEKIIENLPPSINNSITESIIKAQNYQSRLSSATEESSIKKYLDELVH